jgi:hypothetical protein
MVSACVSSCITVPNFGEDIVYQEPEIFMSILLVFNEIMFLEFSRRFLTCIELTDSTLYVCSYGQDLPDFLLSIFKGHCTTFLLFV